MSEFKPSSMLLGLGITIAGSIAYSWFYSNDSSSKQALNHLPQTIAIVSEPECKPVAKYVGDTAIVESNLDNSDNTSPDNVEPIPHYLNVNVSDVLKNGLSEELKKEFENEPFVQLDSDLDQDPALISEVLTKITQLPQGSIEREYLVAIVSGMNNVARTDASLELINSSSSSAKSIGVSILRTVEDTDYLADTIQGLLASNLDTGTLGEVISLVEHNPDLQEQQQLRGVLLNKYQVTSNTTTRLDILQAVRPDSAIITQLSPDLSNLVRTGNADDQNGALEVIEEWVYDAYDAFSSDQRERLVNDLELVSNDPNGSAAARVKSLQLLLSLQSIK